jgi:acetoin utilization protein AcuB
MVVSEIMTPNPTTIDVGEDLDQALDAMAQLRVRHLPVTEEGRLIGMLSDRDLAPLRETASSSSDELPSIASLMSADVASVNQEAEVVEVIDLMLEEKIGAVPVVDEDSGEVVGVVSYVDVLTTHADVLD